MMDRVSPETRSRIMASIRGRDTGPEMALRRALHGMGLRYRCHGRLPGRPDIVFPSRRCVVFVHGCFWHFHGCGLSKMPQTRVDFWRAKFDRNRANDARALDALSQSGWRSLVVWECDMRRDLGRVAQAAYRFVVHGEGGLL